MSKHLILPFIFVFITQFTFAADDSQVPPITNLGQIAKALQLQKFNGQNFGRKIKVAILDNGFGDYESEKGKGLPANTKYHGGASSAADKFENQVFHGLLMAKIVAQVIKKSGAESNYELHLYNSYGYKKFESAVKSVIKNRFDIVLYSQTWEFGGNGDSKGFINALVDKAVAAGIVWVNAAGNFGQSTRTEPIVGRREKSGEWVIFKNKGNKIADGVKVTCHAEKNEECNLRLVLAWNDFKDQVKVGTDKDLDLFLYDRNKKLIASSELHQKISKDPSDPLTSLVPRETVSLNVKPGDYIARVKIVSDNFSSDDDQLRLTLSGYQMGMSAFRPNETILPPADNPGVITVGTTNDPNSSRSKELGRPDVSLGVGVKLKGSSILYSTSISAAIAAAYSVLEVGTGTPNNREAVLAALRAVAGTQQGPTAAGCLKPHYDIPMRYNWVDVLLSGGGVTPVLQEGQIIFFTNYNFAKVNGIRLQSRSQAIYLTPVGTLVTERIPDPAAIPFGYYEIRGSKLKACN